MNVFQAAIFSALTIAGNIATSTERMIDNRLGVIYSMKRLFGPSSAKKLTKMSQAEKDAQLLFYAKQEFPEPFRGGTLGFCLGKWQATSAIFTPHAKHFDDIIYLIEHGASVNLDIPYHWWAKVGDSGTFKPIYLFIKANDLQRTKKLLERGATVGEVLSSKTALSLAETVEMAQLLIDYGAVILYEQDYIHEAIADAEYAPELIPFYLSHYEGDKLAFAQAIWDALRDINMKRQYRLPELRQQFHKKKQYLKDAGVEIDAQWDDDAFVWPKTKKCLLN